MVPVIVVGTPTRDLFGFFGTELGMRIKVVLVVEMMIMGQRGIKLWALLGSKPGSVQLVGDGL